MKLLNIISIIIFSVSYLKAQEENFTYCQKVAPWEDFMIDSSLEETKSGILIVTNRIYSPEEEEFLQNDIEHWRLATYFLASCKSNKWHLTHINNLETGLDIINTGGDMVLFVHGHRKTFPTALNRASLIHERYNVSVVLFDWPSNNKHLHYSQARVRHCSENFYNTTLQLKNYRKSSMTSNQHLSLFAHSLGNYFLTYLVVNGNNQYMNEVFIDNLVLNAAAVKSKDQAKVISQLKFQKQLYIALNENDYVLRGASIVNYGKMLGNLVTLPLAPNAEYIHFTAAANTQHTYFAGFHHFEYDNPAFFDFYNAAFHGLKIDLNNQNYYLKRTHGDGFEIKHITK